MADPAPAISAAPAKQVSKQAAPRNEPSGGKARLRDSLAGIALATPATALMLALLIGPTLAVGFLSLTDWGFGARSFAFIGLDNYAEMAGDPVFRRSLINTLVYVGVVMPVSVALALGVALLIQGGRFGRTFFRTAYFLPVASTLVAMATVWQFMLHPNLGLVNEMLRLVGLAGPNWLTDRGLVLFTLAGIGIWETIGYNMILFLAGLMAIPGHLYEAAEVDGAHRPLDKFLTVTWPMLGPTTLFVIVITAIRSFRVFESVAVLTQGGPGNASQVLLFTMYRESFVYFRAGYGAALTIVFLAFILILTLIQIRVIDRRVHYA